MRDLKWNRSSRRGIFQILKGTDHCYENSLLAEYHRSRVSRRISDSPCVFPQAPYDCEFPEPTKVALRLGRLACTIVEDRAEKTTEIQW